MPTPETSNRTELFEKALQWGLAALVGAAATVLTGAFGFLNKDRELDIRMVDVALTILSGENTDQSIFARRFAINTLAKYSGVDISEGDRTDWAAFGQLPRGDFPQSGDSARPGPLPIIDTGNFSPEDHTLALARAICGEAGGEPEDALRGVANVVMNRVRSPNFPETIGQVVYQRFAFGSMMTSAPGWARLHTLVPGSSEAFDTCYGIARSAAGGNLADNTLGATHYHADFLSPAWAKSPDAKITLRAGRLVFYTGIQ